MNKKEPIKDYIDFNNYLEKAGYRHYKPKIGSLGRALIEASKHQGRSTFLSKMLDVYFRKLRQQKKSKDTHKKNELQQQNSRHHILSNAANNTKTGSKCSTESNGCSTNRQSL